MTAYLIGFAICVGPALAWHLHVVARRWPDDLEHPSGPVNQKLAAAGDRPGPDGPRSERAAR